VLYLLFIFFQTIKINAVDLKGYPDEDDENTYAKEMVCGTDIYALLRSCYPDPQKSEKGCGADHIEQSFFTKQDGHQHENNWQSPENRMAFDETQNNEWNRQGDEKVEQAFPIVGVDP
jgi:hypothetical protein